MEPFPSNLKPGLELIDAGDLEGAISFFQEALKTGTDPAAAWYGYGRACFVQREFPEAIECFDMAVRHGANHPNVYLYRAWTGYHGETCEQDRIDDARRVLASDPENAWAKFFVGDALADQGEYEAAIETFRECLKLKPDWCEPYFHWARCLQSLDDEDGAKEKYITSAQFETYDENIYHRRAHALERYGEIQLALADFNRGLAISPNSSWHGGCRDRMLKGLGWNGEDDPVEFVSGLGSFDEDDGIMMEKRYLIFDSIRAHFGDVPLDEIDIVERTYAFRASPDVQVALNELEEQGYEVVHFFAPQRIGHKEWPRQFFDLYNKDRRNPFVPASPSYEDFDIGEEKAFRCLKAGVWMLRDGDMPLHVLLFTGEYDGIKLEVSAPRTEAAGQSVENLFDYVNRTIERSRCYRGKVLSLEHKEMYSGQFAGIMVHKLKSVPRDEVILATATLDLIDRNVLRFTKQRKRLAELGMSTKKGLLFYGPPGNGKTHTIRYLAHALERTTMLLITGEQVGNLDEYMTLARMLQPSVVVFEDVDLIARQRDNMHNPAEEIMLNKLLNEMDGTKTDAEIIFILTTNRPKILEQALTARPGRIDQAIEFPLPDEAGRHRLVRLYAHGVAVAEELVDHIVKQTENVSASFIRELMRRAVQFALDRNIEAKSLAREDINSSLDELFTSGGSLNRALLGAAVGVDVGECA